MRLTRNFTTDEMLGGRGGLRRPTQAQLTSAWQLCAYVLQPLRDWAGMPVWITSGARSPSHNRRIGGSDTSQHLYATHEIESAPGVKVADAAVDVNLDDRANVKLRLDAVRFMVETCGHAMSQLVWYPMTNHLHIGLAVPRLPGPVDVLFKHHERQAWGSSYERIKWSSGEEASISLAELDAIHRRD